MASPTSSLRGNAAAFGTSSLKQQLANGTRFPWLHIRILLLLALVDSSLAGAAAAWEGHVGTMLAIGSVGSAVLLLVWAIEVALRGLTRRLDAIWSLANEEERAA